MHTLKDDGTHPKYAENVDLLQMCLTHVHLQLSLPFCQAWRAYLNSVQAQISWHLVA